MKWLSIAVILFSLSAGAAELRHGFRLIKEEPLKDLSAKGLVFEHVKTGARLAYISNDDSNKFFTITFKTPPANDEGIPHIIEHSVLGGSKKYPVKDPFAELDKGSLKTFLNAFTAPEHTCYIFGSTNDRDFMNMMDVYLDAVFYPLIHDSPLTLKQEGWRLEIDPKTKKATYNGIVYNEMKGVFADPESLQWDAMMKTMFPNTPYRFESGGIPDKIPDLTNEEFTAFHKQYYHPSNSYIFIYGNGKIDEQLKMLDGVLSNFDKKVVPADIPLETKFQGLVRKVEPLPVRAKDKVANRAILSLNFMVGENKDAELVAGLRILKGILADMEGSPLKRAIKQAGIGEQVDVQLETAMRQNLVVVMVKNADEKKTKIFEQVVFKELSKLAQGIDKDLIRAAINLEEFRLKELDADAATKGARLNHLVLSSWIFDGDPFAHLKFDALISGIRQKAENGYFEKLIAANFLNNKQVSLVSVVPKRGLAEKKDKETTSKLKKLVAKMSKDELAATVKLNEELAKKQKTPDRPEDLAKLPFLQLKDIGRDVEKYPTDVDNVTGTALLKHDLPTKGIIYFSSYFDLAGVSEEKLQYVPVLAYLISKIDTQKYPFAELSKRISIDTGGIRADVAVYEDFVSKDAFYPRLVVRGKSLAPKFPEFIDLFNEVLAKAKFADKARITELVKELRSGFEQRVLQDGHYFASQRALAYSVLSRRMLDRLDGTGFVLFLDDLVKRMDKDPEKVIAELKEVSRSILQRPNMVIGVTANKEVLKGIRSNIEKFAKEFSNETMAKQKWTLLLPERNEAFSIPSEVNYNAEAYDYRNQKMPARGVVMVMNQLLSSTYLYEKIRVQNGAYGSFVMFAPQGALALVSYRDPQVAETYKVYSGTAEYLKTYKAEKRDHDRVIISTIARMDMPLSARDKGVKGDEDYITHRTWEDRKKVRDDVLGTSIEQVREAAACFEKTEQGKAALISNEKAKATDGIFKSVKSLISGG